MKFPFWPNPSGYRDIELGLTRVFQLLERLGNPHLKIPPTIHIAGTNGKGSTQAFLRAIFEENNFKIHSYTSPHLVNFNERILLAGAEISDEFLTEILTECQNAAQENPKIAVTFFEGITVAAFLAFSRIPADVLLLEVGMGGRLDATNVLPKVLASVITPIDFDHQDFLGDTLEKIAFEKAGIIKKNCPVFVAKQNEEALKTIENQARAMDCEIYNLDKKFLEFAVSLAGNHQHQNAALAATLAQNLFAISDEKIASALKKTKWPARLQKINHGKFFEMLPRSCELYLDGSHNPQGAMTVRDFLKSKNAAKKIVIFGMLKDKNCAEFLEIIASEIDQLVTIEIPDETKSRSASEILEIAQKLKINSQTAQNLEDAFTKIKTAENALVLVCGSLYLAGNFLGENR